MASSTSQSAWPSARRAASTLLIQLTTAFRSSALPLSAEPPRPQLRPRLPPPPRRRPRSRLSPSVGWWSYGPDRLGGRPLLPVRRIAITPDRWWLRLAQGSPSRRARGAPGVGSGGGSGRLVGDHRGS